MKTQKQNKLMNFKKLSKNCLKFHINLFFFFLIFFNFTLILPLKGDILTRNEENKLKEKKRIDWDARFEYARLLNNLKRYDESFDQYQKLLIEKPDSIPVQIEIARILYYQGKNQEGSTLLEKIPEKELDDKTRLQIAEVYQMFKEYGKAESIFRDYLKKKPDDVLIKLKLAEQLSWEKKYDESILLYQELLAKNPNDLQLRRKYAMVLMWMGKEREAAEEFEKTLKD